MPPVLRMGKYLLDGLLGPGGVTETYLAHAEANDKPGASVELCALKLLRADRVPEGAFAKVAARFLSAGRQLRDFHRPGFCKIVDVSDDPSATFLIAEYVAGCDLGRLLDTCLAEGKIGVHPALAGLIGSEVARLLHVGHSAKPIFPHLGLCPQNVVVAASGQVTLLDPGIAAALRGLSEQPPERWALVAPELQGVDVGASTLGEHAAVAADLYSLGALLFLLLAGHTPDPGAELPELPGVTGRLAAALRTLLARQPDDRPESAAVLVDWLAGDAAEVRDRQQMIAQGVRVAEKGLRGSPQGLPAVMSESPHPLAGTATVEGMRFPAPRRSRRMLFALLALALACAGAALVGRWPSGPERELAVGFQRQGEMHGPTVQTSSGNLAASTGSQAPQPTAAASGDLLARVAGHLIVETVPPGAMVWVDGAFKGTTFADIVVGGGKHRVDVIAPGHRMLRDLVDTSRGAIIRRTLAEVSPAQGGQGFLDVSCRTVGTFPVLVDDKETGFLCPVKLLPTATGRHGVSIFVPTEGRSVSVEATVEVGSRPASVTFSE